MKVYQTNAALDHRQFAYLIRLDKSKNGYNYFCIGLNYSADQMSPYDAYTIGEIIKDLDDIYVDESNFKIENSFLFGSFLFDFFLKNATNEQKIETFLNWLRKEYVDARCEGSGSGYNVAYSSATNSIYRKAKKIFIKPKVKK